MYALLGAAGALILLKGKFRVTKDSLAIILVLRGGCWLVILHAKPALEPAIQAVPRATVEMY